MLWGITAPVFAYRFVWCYDWGFGRGLQRAIPLFQALYIRTRVVNLASRGVAVSFHWEGLAFALIHKTDDFAFLRPASTKKSERLLFGISGSFNN